MQLMPSSSKAFVVTFLSNHRRSVKSLGADKTFPFSFARVAPRHRSWLRHAGDGPATSLISVAKEHLLCGRKRVFTRKGFPSLPPRRCVSRHAAGDRHWPCSTGGCAVVSRKAENSTPYAREGRARLSSVSLAGLERLSHRPSASIGSCTAARTPNQRAFVQRAVRDLESLQPRLN